MLVFFRVSIGDYAVAYHFHSLYVSKIGFGAFDRKSANDGNNRNKGRPIHRQTRVESASP